MLLKILPFAIYSSPVSVEALQSGEYLNYLILQWQHSHLTTTRFKSLFIFSVASPCPVLHTCSFSPFCMTYACCIHNFVIKLYAYGLLKVVHLRKFCMLRKTLFCWRCNLKRKRLRFADKNCRTI
jgi:hypothetical protein